MTEKEAVALVDEIRSAYPAVKLSPSTLRMWVRGLQAMRHDVAKVAVRSMIENEKWPSVSDLHNHYSIAAAQHRRQLEEDRRRLERIAEDNMQRPELREIPAAQEHLQKLRGTVVDDFANLERVDDGKCDDCRKDGGRFKFERLGLCSRCVAARLRVKRQVEDAA